MDNNKSLIKGKRIYLRLLTINDASQEYCQWLNDSEVNKYLETKNTTIQELREYIQERIDSPNALFFGIFDKEKHIGNIKLEPIFWERKKVIFGFIIGDKKYWGKGIGTEATKLIVDFVFNFLNLDEVELGVLPQNKAAVRVYEKVGFIKVPNVKRLIDPKNNMIDTGGALYRPDDIIMIINKNNELH